MIKIIEADLSCVQHAEAVISLLDQYARDPMGGGAGLSEEVKQTLIPQLEKRADRLILLAMHNDTFVGLLNGFEGFSTFAAQPLLNIHDVFVDASVRGLGVGHELLIHAEHAARERGYFKMTLEVLTGNMKAQGLYRARGFSGYSLDAATGQAMFWQKKLR